MTLERNTPPQLGKAARTIFALIGIALIVSTFYLGGRLLVQVIFIVIGLILFGIPFIDMRAERIFRKGTFKTPGVIVRKFVTQDVSASQDGAASVRVDHFVEVRYTAANAKPPRGEMTVKAQIKQPLYNKLAEQGTVNIEYAVEDPIMFRIEGE